MMASAPVADDVHGPGGAKKDTGGGGAGPGAVRAPEQGLKCPRCDSPNTKFCYYNNYSLAQPRYFCKTCRRYWTKGGALRNVPVGGGCRKSKKSKSSSSSSSSAATASAASSSRLSSSDGELRLYQLGLPPTVDFHLGSAGLHFSRLHHPSTPGLFNTAAADGGAANHLISFGDLSLPTEAAGATAAAPLIGFGYPIQAVAPPAFADVGIAGGGGDAATPGTTLASMHGNLAASIESLSSINQGLHWKLQQQRLAMLFGGGDQSSQHHQGRDDSSDAAAATNALPAALLEGPSRPMSCQAPASSEEVCVAAAGGGLSRKGSMVGEANSSTTEWFLDNSTAYTTPHAHSSLNNNGGASSSNWSGVQTWNDMHQFSALP